MSVKSCSLSLVRNDKTHTRLKKPLSVCALLLLLMSPSVVPAQDDKVHPYTQQMYTEWLGKLDVAESASKPGSNTDMALPILEEAEGWYNQQKQTLARHPDYKIALNRQLILRMKQTRITALNGLAFAEAAIKQQKTDLLSGRGGAYDQLSKADKLVESFIELLGSDQQPVKDLVAYVEQVRAKVQEKAAQVTSGGISLAVPPGAKVDSFTQQTFEEWVARIVEDTGILAGDKSFEEKINELENGRKWFQSNHQSLIKHPNFDQGLAKMNPLMLGLAELRSQRAVALAEQGLKEMNPNLFNESSGTYQQIRDAEKLVTQFGGGLDTAKVSAAIENAKTRVAGLSEEYNKKSIASFKQPADLYSGGDKAQHKQEVLSRWKMAYPNDEILGIVFPSANWDRRNEFMLSNNTWHHYDDSTLVVYVVIKKSSDLATVHPAIVRKDNLSGAITYNVQTKSTSYSHQDMLLKNVDF